ncbi:pentapeptide repeat-containing protein [Streptomyces hydrogenans]|uniref:pentapeptide repeat-containing protein n=1 Tax=Streptomyces hydrogenans TaxID=1873719 RepID=UPI0035E365A9
MTSSVPTPPPADAPEWPHCGQGATSDNPVGCPGIRVKDYNACLAHLDESDLNAYLTSLIFDPSLDHRGTTFTASLWERVIRALRGQSNPQLIIQSANFEQATFNCEINLVGAKFVNDARFNKATFNHEARFTRATFQRFADFGQSKFMHAAKFSEASFHSVAEFAEAEFKDNTFFDKANFLGVSQFNEAHFHGLVRFIGSIFSGSTQFDSSKFDAPAYFNNTHFKKPVLFSLARFSEATNFRECTFTEEAYFQRSTFAKEAQFSATTFEKKVDFVQVEFNEGGFFNGSQFNGEALFIEATFGTVLEFSEAVLSDSARFDRVRVGVDASFFRTRFDGTPYVGPLICGQIVRLDGSVFQQPVTIEVSAPHVSCVRTRWASTATLRLRGTELDLSDAVFEYPVLVTAHPTPFWPLPSPSEPPSPVPQERRNDVRLVSVQGVDAALLVLNDIDLSLCRFAGAVHLDQLKVDGRCAFAASPSGWSRRFPWKWSRRNTLLEEHHWRVRAARNGERAIASGWAEPDSLDPDLKPAVVAALYRQLRKSLEDGKNEPDAADFYYGECEMRRHDLTRPRGERLLLRLYWALSGYGLRATRALVWLGVSVAVTMAVMMLWGLPADDPKPATTGRQVAVGQEISLVTDTPKPVNPTNAVVDRITTDRFEKSLRVVINSVVFRSSGQNLTTAGTYAEMISRLAEPVLLGLAVLAIRSRVKR